MASRRASRDQTAASGEAQGRVSSRGGKLHNACAVPIFAGVPAAAVICASSAARREEYRWGARLDRDWVRMAERAIASRFDLPSPRRLTQVVWSLVAAGQANGDIEAAGGDGGGVHGGA